MVEGRGTDRGELVEVQHTPDAEPEGAIWRTLNGHEAGNRGDSQGNEPTSNPWGVCYRGWSEYGRQREGMRVFGAPICSTT